LNILILLVIAFIIITAVFIGYSVTQREPVAEEHGISIDLETLNQHEQIQLFSKPSILSVII
jgi:hypothetical protein